VERLDETTEEETILTTRNPPSNETREESISQEMKLGLVGIQFVAEKS